MFSQLMTALKGNSANNQPLARRRFTRRHVDQCMSVINGKAYPVKDWSLGGLQVIADERDFALGQQADVTMKFRLRNDIMDIPHEAYVVRKSNGKVAFEFAPLTRKIRNSFQTVVDDYVSRQFAESQEQF